MDRSHSLRRTVWATCLCLSAASGFVRAASVPEIKGIALGASLDNVKAAQISPACGDDNYSKFVTCTFVSTLGGANADFVVTIRDNHVTEIAVSNIDPDGFAGVESALRKKFGKPGMDRGGYVTNALGARFDDRTLVWKGRGWQLQAKKRAGKVNESTVQLFSDLEADRANARSRSDADDS